MEDSKKEAPQVNITPDAAEAAINALGEMVAELKEEVKALKTQLSATSSVQLAPEKAETPLPEADEFNSGGKKYRFAVKRFILDGATVLAHEAAKDKALRDKIVKDYPGLVQEV